MRRKDRRITEAEAFALLEQGDYGILSTASSSNEPYGVPLNYCLMNEGIYVHCAVEGRKLSNMSENPRVSFCVVGKTEVLADKFATNYESCIVQGLAAEVFGEEKQLALEGLINKYSKNFVPEGLQYIEKLKDKTKVFRITLESVSGKARK